MATAVKWWLASSSACILPVLCCSAWAATKLASPDTNSRCEGQCIRTCHVPHHRTWPRLQGMMDVLSGDLPSAVWHPAVYWPYIGMLLANCWFPDQFLKKWATWTCGPLYKVLLLLWPHMIVSSSTVHSVLFTALHSRIYIDLYTAQSVCRNAMSSPCLMKPVNLRSLVTHKPSYNNISWGNLC